MSNHRHPVPSGDVPAAVREAIEAAIPGARAEVTGGSGHYTIVVRAAAFEGKSMLESHRLVLASIAHLMQGDAAPVHAVDSLRTLNA